LEKGNPEALVFAEKEEIFINTNSSKQKQKQNKQPDEQRNKQANKETNKNTKKLPIIVVKLQKNSKSEKGFKILNKTSELNCPYCDNLHYFHNRFKHSLK
jgi:hypothetical protein